MKKLLLAVFIFITTSLFAISMEDWIRQGGKERDKPYMPKCHKYCIDAHYECVTVVKDSQIIGDEMVRRFNDCYEAYLRCMDRCKADY